MIYAMSDLHGQYDSYRRMLRQIHFSGRDTLYILGDVVDRGPEPVRLLQDMMLRSNVYPIMGNHELMALHIIRKLSVEITDENYDSYLNSDLLSAVVNWQMNGGEVTMKQLQALPADEREELLDYIEDFPLYETVDAGERTFVLVHAGLGNFSVNKKLDEYTADELTFIRPDGSRRLFPDPSVYVVFGHTPTLSISGKAEIWEQHNNICIDCGATFDGGRLACLCLDTMERFYV